MNLPGAKTLSFPKDGTSIDCVSFGSPLALLPGLSFQRVKGAAPGLAYMYRAFAKTHTVYVIDRKDTVPDGYTIGDIAGDTAYVMERLGLSGADVFGGGMVAQYLAIYYPELVLGGRDDKVLTAEASEEIAGALGCELYMYEDLGHAAYEEARDFNKRISLFLSDDTEGG